MTFSTGSDTLGPGEAAPAVFDWYSATLPPDTVMPDRAKSEAVTVAELLRDRLGNEIRAGRARHGYAERYDVLAGQAVACTVSGGAAHGRLHIEGTGPRAVALADVLREVWPVHRVTRLDSAVDFDGDDAWGALCEATLGVVRERKIKTQLAGDWLDGKAGRTLMVGGKTAIARVRVYEKGKQLVAAERPNWVRVELQLRPDKFLKDQAAKLTPVTAWGASTWASEVYQRVTASEVPRIDVSRWREPDDVRARAALLKQYGPLLVRWADDFGGSFRVLGEHIGDELGYSAAFDWAKFVHEE